MQSMATQMFQELLQEGRTSHAWHALSSGIFLNDMCNMLILMLVIKYNFLTFYDIPNCRDSQLCSKRIVHGRVGMYGAILLSICSLCISLSVLEAFLWLPFLQDNLFLTHKLRSGHLYHLFIFYYYCNSSAELGCISKHFFCVSKHLYKQLSHKYLL